jgi:hypothetical protein
MNHPAMQTLEPRYNSYGVNERHYIKNSSSLTEVS